MIEKFSIDRVLMGDENHIKKMEALLYRNEIPLIEKEVRLSLVKYYTLGEGEKRKDHGANHLKRSYDLALYHARKLVEKYSLDAAFILKFSWILINVGHFKEAENNLLNLYDKKSNFSFEFNANVLAALARLYYKFGHFKRAFDIYEQISLSSLDQYDVVKSKKAKDFLGNCIARMARIKINSGSSEEALSIINKYQEVIGFNKLKGVKNRAELLLEKGYLSSNVESRKVDSNKLTIVCVKHGTKYGAEYVNRLYSMVRRNLTGDWQFVCMTDNSVGLNSEIDVIDISSIKVSGWWTKVSIFDRRLPLLHETVFYLDLDTVVIGNLDFINELKVGFYIFEHPDAPIFNSSIMLFDRSIAGHIFDKITLRDVDRLPGDQEWIEECIPNADIFDDGKINLYRGINPNITFDELSDSPTKIVTFPANPKPHDVTSSWVELVWR